MFLCLHFGFCIVFESHCQHLCFISTPLVFLSFFLQKSFIESPAKPHLKCISQVVNIPVCRAQSCVCFFVEGTQQGTLLALTFGVGLKLAGTIGEDLEGGKNPPKCHSLQGAAHDQRQEVSFEDIQVSQ